MNSSAAQSERHLPPPVLGDPKRGQRSGSGQSRRGTSWRTTARIYIGGGGDEDPNIGETEAPFDRYLEAPDEWSFVRANVHGFYVSNFALPLDSNGHCPVQEPKLEQMASLLTNKVVFYETDIRPQFGTDYDDKRRIDILRYYFNEVSYASLFAGYTANLVTLRSRIHALQWRYPRPVLASEGAWNIGGDINIGTTQIAQGLRIGIENASGSGTDGPMGVWAVDQDQMRAGSYSLVKYAHAREKLAMVMLAPYDPHAPNSAGSIGSGIDFLRRGQDCVRLHEQNGASPDVWVISYYGAYWQRYPVTPEQIDGQPAGTITGLAYWLIHHLNDPVNWP